MIVPDLVANAATRFPARTAIIEGHRRLTFHEVDERADRLVRAFADASLHPGDRVAILAENELEYLELHVALQRAQLIGVPLNHRLAVPELAHIVSDCRPRLLVHGPGFADAARQLDVEQTWHLGADGVGVAYEEALGSSPPAPRRPLRHDTAASILYTSGTTGRPKGAILSNGALWARSNMFGLEIGIRPDDVFVQALPMFHMAAHVAHAFTYRGATTVLQRAFTPGECVELLHRHAASHVLLVPTMINLVTQEPSLADADLSSLRMVLYGASPISPEVLRRAIDALRCDFLQFFGMTETAGASLLRPADHDPDRHPERLASAGTDAISFETRVVGPDDVDLPPGEVGEILSRGPCLMDGYWNAPEATAAALAGGWMHTGDLGYRDEAGYLHVTDRLKDMIVTGGENVYPREVEDVLHEHPDVLEVAVIGVPHERWGEAVHALVVPQRDRRPDPADLLAHCRSRLAGYKVPKAVELVDALPKNATGKILKRTIREAYWKGAARQVG